MNYTRCTFQLIPQKESFCDVLASMLGEIGYESFIINNGELEAYIPSSQYSKEETENLIRNIPIPNIKISYTAYHIDQKDWNNEWESTFSPIMIDDIAYIHSSSYPCSKDFPYDIIINPRMSFGSGSHSTTRMVLRMLFSTELQGKKVLDLGCGTGILGIASKIGGCKSVTALDTDSQCITNTQQNYMLNGVECELISEGSIDSLDSDNRFDIILANIHLNIHISLMEQYSSHLLPGGTLILSGFYTSDIPLIKETSEYYGLSISECVEEEKWTALRLEKSINFHP